MAHVKLRKLISQSGDLISIISGIISLSDTPIAVWDMEGNILIDPLGTSENEPLETHPIIVENQNLGVVRGGGTAALVAALLSSLASMEEAKKALGKEVLDLYREINLLYNLSEKLSVSLKPTVVAKLTLDEASRLIPASLGVVMLYDIQEGVYKSIASFGDQSTLDSYLTPINGLANRVRESGKAEIINDSRSPNRNSGDNGFASSIICVPLNTNNKTIGVIFLARESEAKYSAADLKLLTTVSHQAAPVIENAYLHQKALEEAKHRENTLRRQVQELRIELNLGKQEQKVSEITESDYFQRLRKQATTLRNIIDSD